MTTWTYAPAPESATLANLRPAYRPFVDGTFVDGGGEPLKTLNPATEEALAEVGTAFDTGVAPPARLAESAANAGPIDVRQRFWFNPNLDDRRFFLAGLAGMLLTNLCLSVSCLALVGERVGEIVERLTPLIKACAEIVIDHADDRARARGGPRRGSPSR